MASRHSEIGVFVAEGRVVGIFGHAQQVSARVLLTAGTVVELTVGGDTDLHLGDEVRIEGDIRVLAPRSGRVAGTPAQDV